MKKKYAVPVVITILISLIAGGCGQSVISSNVEVSDVRKIKTENGIIHSMSPDGKLILSIGPDAIYFYNSESMDEEQVIELERIRVDPGSVHWSSDSKFVTFCQDFYRTMMEPDIYLVDIADGSLDNLTNDHVDKYNVADPDPDTDIDILPVFMDLKSIMFTRLDFSGSRRKTHLMQVDIKSGEERELIEDSIGEGATILSLNLPDSGKKVYYTISAPKIDDRDNGVWCAYYGKGDFDRIDIEYDKETAPILLTDITGPGEYGLIYYPRLAQSFGSMNSPPVFNVVNLKDGEIIPVLEDEDNEIIGPYNAIFSPDGKRVLYLYGETKSNKKSLAIRDVKGGRETVLWTDEETTLYQYYHVSSVPGLNWAKNNTLFIATSQNSALILELEKK